MSIRLRLTLIFSSILAFTLIVFSVILFVIQSQFTLNMIESDLKRAASPIANRFHFTLADPERIISETGNGVPKTQPWFGNPPNDASETRMRDSMHLLDPDGNPTDLPLNQDTPSYPIIGEGLNTLHSGESWAEIIIDEEERLLVYNHPAVE